MIFSSALSQLDLTHNKIEFLPDSIGNLRKLEQLYLRHNRLKNLPPLHSCSALKELYLGNNFIKVICDILPDWHLCTSLEKHLQRKNL